VNLLGDNINTREKQKTVIVASTEIGIKGNAEDTKFMLLFRLQNAGQIMSLRGQKG
jgi:hypothetical protein